MRLMRACLREWLRWPLMGLVALQLMLGSLAHPHALPAPAAAPAHSHAAGPAASQHDGHCAEGAAEAPRPAVPHDGHGRPCCPPDDCHCNISVAVPAPALPALGFVAWRSSADAETPAPPRPRPDRLLRPPATPILA